MRKAVMILMLSTSMLMAEVPTEITYQGRLREYGQPVNGTRTMQFAIYDALTNGIQQWSSGDVVIAVSSGVFSYTLAPTTVDWRGKDFWIETVISGKVLSPREKITAQAFALHAKTAESITRSSGDVKFEIGSTSYVVVTTAGLRVNSGAITFPDGSSMTSAGSGSAVSISNNSDAVIGADADANGSGKVQIITAGSEKMSIHNDGKVGIGTENPASRLHIAGESSCNLTIQEFSNDSTGPGLVPAKCRNTQTVPNPIQANDILFHVSPAPYINAAIRDIGSHIEIVAENGPSGNYVPTRIDLCTASNSSMATPKMTIKSDGCVGISSSNPTCTLTVNGSFNLLPPGMIVAYGGNNDPDGWMLCDGRSLIRSNYPALFNAIGTAFGSVDGTHFNIPDFRGRFLRGRDSFQGRDPDRALRSVMNPGGNSGDNVGSLQDDCFETHTHEEREGNGTAGSGTYEWPDLHASLFAGTDPLSGTVTAPTGGNETRPVNAYVNYMIKY